MLDFDTVVPILVFGSTVVGFVRYELTRPRVALAPPDPLGVKVRNVVTAEVSHSGGPVSLHDLSQRVGLDVVRLVAEDVVGHELRVDSRLERTPSGLDLHA